MHRCMTTVIQGLACIKTCSSFCPNHKFGSRTTGMMRSTWHKQKHLCEEQTVHCPPATRTWQKPRQASTRGAVRHLCEIIEGSACSQVAVQQVVQVADVSCLPATCHLGQPPTTCLQHSLHPNQDSVKHLSPAMYDGQLQIA